MKLNIYCGIRSIGWNITDENKVIAYGVKRVNVDFDSYYAFIAGLPVAKRIDRRMKRQARRNLWRYKTRRAKLMSLLKADGFEYRGKSMSRQELNTAREASCMGKIPDHIIGRVLLDIQRKRGYKSLRGVDDTGDSDYLKIIETHENALKDYDTVGSYLNSLKTCKNVILRRETYEREFYRICETQGINPERYYGAIFHQRPLKKGKIGYCRCEPRRKVTHASNPVYQEFRVLRDVNNIEIFDIENNQIEISGEHRRKFLDILFSGKDLTKAGCLKIMGIKKPAQYKWYSGKSISGNIWGKLNKPEPYALWQDLISATDNDKLINILVNKGYSPEKASELANYDIKGIGYADYSEKAIKKLIPILKQGKTLSEAIMEVFGKVDFGADTALRNVVLEQVHASCSSLIKAIKNKHEISELQIEIDSLLKKGNKARKALASSKRRAEKDKAELDRRIIEAEAEPTEYNRKKLRHWDETGGICPYFPENKIELEDLFTDKYNLDHVVPKSKLFDFSDENLVLCPADENFEKMRTTGRDFVEKHGKISEYCETVNSLKISESKKALLLMREQDIPNDYISRSAGTDYNTRCFLALHTDARCIPNKLVNMYSKKWYANPYDENDVRQSLVKSFVIANMSGETVKYFDNIREHTHEQTSAGAYDLRYEIPLPDLENVPVFCPKTKFFRRTKHGYIARFALHEETVFG
jgi:CRISPR-associated endonuclease Csn1